MHALFTTFSTFAQFVIIFFGYVVVLLLNPVVYWLFLHE